MFYTWFLRGPKVGREVPFQVPFLIRQLHMRHFESSSPPALALDSGRVVGLLRLPAGRLSDDSEEF